MKKRAGEANIWSLAEAARVLDVSRRDIKAWRQHFDLFDGDEFDARDMRTLRALKALLHDHGYAREDVARLFETMGEAAVIAAYGGPPSPQAQVNPARALQDAVRSAAAAGFFGEVYAAVEDEAGDSAAPSVASYAQARLARLK
jgi:hypothetical protein